MPRTFHRPLSWEYHWRNHDSWGKKYDAEMAVLVIIPKKKETAFTRKKRFTLVVSWWCWITIGKVMTFQALHSRHSSGGALISGKLNAREWEKDVWKKSYDSPAVPEHQLLILDALRRQRHLFRARVLWVGQIKRKQWVIGYQTFLKDRNFFFPIPLRVHSVPTKWPVSRDCGTGAEQ